MAEETTAAEAGGQTDIVQRSAGGDGPLSAMEAARSLVDQRRKDNAQQRTGEAPEAATAQESASQEADTAQETGPGETQEADAEPEAPPIEPPRSWTKEDKELFRSLPPETQQRVADRERSREADFLRRQNEAAEKSKGLTAKEQAAEQVRAQYEQALPMLLQALQDQHAGTFADIKTIADVERMASEDWPRYVQWDAHQKKVAAVQREVQSIHARSEQEKASKWSTFAADEDAKFLEKAPEYADKAALTKAASSAAEMLRDLGFSDAELGKLWNGQSEISLRDHRLQLLLRDGVKYREAQAAVKKPVAKPVPQVQRPGPARAPNADADDRVRNLDTRLTSTGSLKDAAALLVARRAARQ